ncbi:membrane cofactor protein-like [Bos indicus x Bos taurus]|uniref:membrane cofactor protein-like n=1 Tax=Bos indicus x Bos taurus TaxID=30522 RepID=UPI000F7D42B8|nr:membrane cofactor protein-like [Bos indicus x Bos taurus]
MPCAPQPAMLGSDLTHQLVNTSYGTHLCRDPSHQQADTSSGAPNPAAATLRPEACGDPPRFKTMMLQGEPKPNYHPGECVQYECRLGFKPKLPALPRSAVCQDNNTWSSLQDACVGKSCPNLGDPANGQVNFVNGSVLFGSQAHVSCNPGFYLIGAKVIYCEISGDNVNWSDNLPICEIILCATPGNITNGRFTQYKEVYRYSEVVIYRCDPSNGPDEYSLIGETTLICVDHNRWSSDPPECKVVKCDYPIVENGAIVSGFRGKYYYNMQVVFQCHDGFHLHGSSTIVCGANGTWEPKLPKCSAKVFGFDETRHVCAFGVTSAKSLQTPHPEAVLRVLFKSFLLPVVIDVRY